MRRERVTAQHKAAKNGADVQVACEAEEKELNRKVAIKEKEQAEPTSPSAPESKN